MVKNISPIQTRVKEAVYECRGCMRLLRVLIKEGEVVTVPNLCTECGGRSFVLLHEHSEFINYRYAKLEEPLELRQSGVTREFKAYMDNYLASPSHLIKPGDVCEISGTFDVVNNNKNHEWDFLFKLQHIKPQNSSYEDIRLSDEDIEEIKELSKKEDIFELIRDSISPTVYGHETIKEGIVLQLFEGNRPRDDINKNDRLDRWTINILLIGDPGIAKSKLLKEINFMAPKSIGVSGTGSSQAGLTASAVKDELTGTWAMEAGAFVLADSGVLTIDEFDKLNRNVQMSLNEPMENLTVSTAKAGLVQTMAARTSVLAAANPKFSKWDKYQPLKKQLDIPDSTLSRFDLVYVMEDTVNRDKDKELAVKVLRETINDNEDKSLISVDLLKKYISYAKHECFPVLGEEAEEVISDFYVETRQASVHNDDSKPITLREMKAIERLSIARAKLELRNFVRSGDALDAIRIYKESLRSLGLDPNVAGELKGTKSSNDIFMIRTAECLIKEHAGLYGYNLPESVIADIKEELMEYVKNYEDVDEVYHEALFNVKNEVV